MKKIYAGLAAGMIIACGCTSTFLKVGFKSAQPYFYGPTAENIQLTRLSDHVYTFQWTWYRNIILVTDAGLVVIDPMGEEAARALKTALDKDLPGKPVDTLIYSHYHLDHVRGGAVLAPKHVLAHKKCPDYWKDLKATGIVMPTQLLDGDQTLTIGGMKIEALYLGLSHTDTLYAFYIPSEKLVFTADLGMVKTVPPSGIPDRYTPGYMAALARVGALDFQTFVPSHFGIGTKQDLLDFTAMMTYAQTLAAEAVQRYGALGTKHDQFAHYFDAVYYPMREKYGHWHGFNEMFISNLIRELTGVILGD